MSSNFCVIELVGTTMKSFGKYVIVPSSWINSKCIFTGMKVWLKYPNESPSVIRQRVMNMENLEESIIICSGTIREHTDTFTSAETWLVKNCDSSSNINTRKMKIGPSNTDSSNAETKMIAMPSSTLQNGSSDIPIPGTSQLPQTGSKKKPLSLKRNLPSTSEASVDKKRKIDKTFKKLQQLIGQEIYVGVRNSQFAGNNLASMQQCHDITERYSSEQLKRLGNTANSLHVIQTFGVQTNKNSTERPASEPLNQSVNRQKSLPLICQPQKSPLANQRSTSMVAQNYNQSNKKENTLPVFRQPPLSQQLSNQKTKLNTVQNSASNGPNGPTSGQHNQPIYIKNFPTSGQSKQPSKRSLTSSGYQNSTKNNLQTKKIQSNCESLMCFPNVTIIRTSQIPSHTETSASTSQNFQHPNKQQNSASTKPQSLSAKKTKNVSVVNPFSIQIPQKKGSNDNKLNSLTQSHTSRLNQSSVNSISKNYQNGKDSNELVQGNFSGEYSCWCQELFQVHSNLFNTMAELAKPLIALKKAEAKSST